MLPRIAYLGIRSHNCLVRTWPTGNSAVFLHAGPLAPHAGLLGKKFVFARQNSVKSSCSCSSWQRWHRASGVHGRGETRKKKSEKKRSEIFICGRFGAETVFWTLKKTTHNGCIRYVHTERDTV